MEKNKKIVIANWKMQLSPQEAIAQAKNFKKLYTKAGLEKKVAVAIAPDFLAYLEVAKVLDGSDIFLAAQNGYSETKGAFTGEISLATLKESACVYVLIGHSERRQFFAETDESINNKISFALQQDLIPVLCIGETFQDRKDGRKDVVVMQQVQNALRGIDIKPSQTLIIAYEPVWAIGSGQAMQPAELKHTAMIIRQSLIDVLEDKDLPQVKIIYGGSVNAENINSFTDLEMISGALVGGASLEAEKFIDLIKQI